MLGLEERRSEGGESHTECAELGAMVRGPGPVRRKVLVAVRVFLVVWFVFKRNWFAPCWRRQRFNK